MDRNTENFFAMSPTISAPRSRWPRNFNILTTYNAGNLVPFYVDLDVLPGTTIKQKSTYVVRMNTPLYPTMDNCYLDTYWFWVPFRQVWEHWVDFEGENETGAFEATTQYEIPHFKTDSSHTLSVHDANTYMGAGRLGTQQPSWSKFAVRGYIRVWNYYFRSQDLQAPITMYKGDGDTILDGTIETGCGLLPVNRYHDYFSSATLQPQKGINGENGAVRLPLGTTAPVYGDGTPIRLEKNLSTTATAGTDHGFGFINNSSILGEAGGPVNNDGFNIAQNDSHVFVDLSNAVAATINAQRLAFATQRIRERSAIFGTRYLQETLNGHWNVSVGDMAKGIIPEYLGGKRIVININALSQTSETATTPLGFQGGYSVTVDHNFDFNKSFVEHGMILGLCCVRTDRNYQGNMARQWTRRLPLDFFWPEMSSVGNMPIYNYELFISGNSTIDNQVFGYKEAWAEYKYKPNMISGMLLSDYSQSLDAWHYGDDYSTNPVLSSQWLIEDKDRLDRTLAVTSAVSDQFTMNCYVEQTVAMRMPFHCLPGLIDHF